MKRKIRQAAVIGSGIMGGGIAALFASAGIDTLLLDIVAVDLKKEEENDPAARNRIVKAGLDTVLNSSPALLMQKKDAARIRIGNLEDDLDKLARCDWIVEAVVEDLKIKQTLLKRIEPLRKADAIVSTNTSGIPLKAMSKGFGREFKQHFLGTHFFNPVRYMKLLEIIAGEETLPELLEFTATFGERILGKGIVWAKDTPNFVGNRIGVQGMVKAMQLMKQSGLTIPEVDALFGPVMGRPKTAMFKTCDWVGLDVLGHVARNTHDLVPDDEARDDFVLPPFFHRMVEKRLLGKKSGAGFYKTELTPEWEKIRKVIDPETLEYSEYTIPQFPCLAAAKAAPTQSEKIRAVIGGEDKGAHFAWKVLAHNLIYAANRIPEIADTVVEIDNAVKWGFNFEFGPFETWDIIGLVSSVERMQREGFTVPEKIARMIASGNTRFYKIEGAQRLFYDFSTHTYTPVAVSENVISLANLKSDNHVVRTCDSASLIDIGDGVFCCEFHTKMNTLNSEIIDFISEAINYVGENGVGAVIGNQASGMPGAFSVGADLKLIRELAEKKKFAQIDAFVRRAQQVVQQARYAGFPVVAAPFGLTLGGGCEVCLGADRIVAHAELYMGLVEIGVGLLPASGGCMNLWKKFITSLPDAVTDVDRAKFFIPAFMNIAMAKVSTSAAEARANGFLGPRDRIVFNRDHLIGEAKKTALRMVHDGYTPPMKEKLKIIGRAAQGMINAELFNMSQAGFITGHDAFLARRIAFVLSGGEAPTNSEIDENAILELEREAFLDFLKAEKTIARIDHMLKTGKPLRN